VKFHSLRTRVARRIVLLFVLCSLGPVLALAALSTMRVTEQLFDQSRARLSQTSKSVGAGVLERLSILETALAQVDGKLPESSSSYQITPADSLRFAGLGRQTGEGQWRPLFGNMDSPLVLSSAQREHLNKGRTLLTVAPAGTETSRVLLARRSASGTVLWAELRSTYLWGTRDATALPGVEVCIFGESSPLYCSRPGRVPPQAWSTNGAIGQFDWDAPDGGRLAGYWSVFLRYAYGAPSWTVVLSEPRASVLAPITSFERSFGLVLLLTLIVVFLLSNIQIRRSLNPVEQLQEGTRRIEDREFGKPVVVTSGDEFEELAASFNNMASHLGQQFTMLTAINEIDRAVLAASQSDDIMTTVLSRTCSALGCEAASVSLAQINEPQVWTLAAQATGEPEAPLRQIRPGRSEIDELSTHSRVLPVGIERESRSYLPVEMFRARGIASVVVLPLVLKGRVAGAIGLGYRDGRELKDDEATRARQLADQVAVALSNNRLVHELAAHHWGSLRALARTIDAYSRWTAGHSERVTTTGVAIARTLGLDDEAADLLQRGGLLHDIGKIGVPLGILDKPGKLTEDERRLVEDHPKIGAEILTPIGACRDLIPIVLHHHEQWDGSGYPGRLAGEKIPFLARVLTVADVFDALVSERPYRKGWSRPDAVDYMVKGAGIRYDPAVVAGFCEMIAKEDSLALGQPELLRAAGRVESAA